MTSLFVTFNLIIMAMIQLPQLPYANDALEPQISKETMDYHYGKHHQAYVNNLNGLIPGTKYENMPLDEIVISSEGPIFNNAAQVWNHTFFFFELSPKPQSAPTGELAKAIDRDFGSFDAFKTAFAKAAAGQFGSGWAWLVEGKDGKLSIVTTSNAANPMTQGLKPLMNADVWEHAYYIDYRNRRPDFLTSLWDRIDWKVVEDRYKK